MGLWDATHRPACPVLRHSESSPLGLSVRECGAAGSASGRIALPVSPTVCQSRSCHSNMSPLCPGCRLRPSYRSGWMFIFYLLGVGLPCCSIFCKFWLYEEAQCVYLYRHLGSPSCSIWIFYTYKLFNIDNVQAANSIQKKTLHTQVISPAL